MNTHRPRRAAAMLLALIAVMILPILTLGAVRASTRSVLDSAEEAHSVTARATARSLTPLLLRWASAHESAPNDERVYSSKPVAILESTYDERSGRVRVEAIDLSGRLHTDYLATELSQALPLSLRDLPPTELLQPARSGQLSGDAPRRPPLDVLAPGVRVLPSIKSESLWAQRWLTTAGTGSINVRSAPRELLAAAVVDSDPSVRRAVDETDTINAELARRIISAGRNQRGATNPVPFADRSSAWGFLIVVEDGELTSRWWLIAEASGSSASAWSVAEFRRVLE